MLNGLFDQMKQLLHKDTPAGAETEANKTPSMPQETFDKLNALYKKYSQLFVEKAITGVHLPEHDALCAQISEESYHPMGERTIQMGSFVLDEKNSTLTCAIYADAQQKCCIIGYRGTVFTDIKDITSDAQIVLDLQGIDPRVLDALHMYDTARREYPGYTLEVCGHSLGGTLSYIVAKHRVPSRCVVFNPGVSLNTFFVQMLEDTLKKTSWTQNTYTYKILGDIVSLVAFVGHVKTFTVQAHDPLALHVLANFLPEEKKDEVE